MNGIEIKKRRRSLSLTQTDLAKLLGVTLGTIFNYENGSKIPDSKIILLQKILNSKEQASESAKEETTSDSQNNIKASLIEESKSTYSKRESEETKLAITTFEDMLVEVDALISQLKSIASRTVADMAELHKAYKLRDEITKDIRDYKNK